MSLQALLVSGDDRAGPLDRVLSGFVIALDHSSDLQTAMTRIQQQKLDALVVGFDDQKAAEGSFAAAEETRHRAVDYCPGEIGTKRG